MSFDMDDRLGSLNEDNIFRPKMNKDNSGLDLAGLGAGDIAHDGFDEIEDEEDQGFEEAHDDHDMHEGDNIFEKKIVPAAGGFGDMMGLDDNHDDALKMEMDIMNATGPNAGQAETIAMTVFIGFDEDDDNTHKIDLK